MAARQSELGNAQHELDGCKRRLSEEQKKYGLLQEQCKLLQSAQPSSGNTGSMARHSDTSAVAELDDNLSRLLRRLQELKHGPGETSIDMKAQRIAEVIKETLDGFGSDNAKLEVFKSIVRHLGLSTGSSSKDVDLLLESLHLAIGV